MAVTYKYIDQNSLSIDYNYLFSLNFKKCMKTRKESDAFDINNHSIKSGKLFY